MQPVAVITMVFNEAIKLPIWLRYYGDMFGRESLYVIDNGSTDGSTRQIAPSSVIHAPKTPKFERSRRKFVGDLCRSLLHYYETVIYTDCDEILFPRAGNGSLADYLRQFGGSHVTALGLNMFQDVNAEEAIEFDRPILQQRAKAAFALPMCKTLITRRPIEWSIGFHQSSLPPHFDDIFLLHISNIDLNVKLDRQAVMRPPRTGRSRQAQVCEGRRGQKTVRVLVAEKDFAGLRGRAGDRGLRQGDGLFSRHRFLRRLRRGQKRIAEADLSAERPRAARPDLTLRRLRRSRTDEAATRSGPTLDGTRISVCRIAPREVVAARPDTEGFRPNEPPVGDAARRCGALTLRAARLLGVSDSLALSGKLKFGTAVRCR